MKVLHRVSEEYAAVFTKPFIVAEVIGITIILGGTIAHLFYR
jgi:hypothetical protein